MESDSSGKWHDFIGISRTDSGLTLTLSGEWILKNLSRIEKAFRDLRKGLPSISTLIVVDVSEIRRIDTSGMIFLCRCVPLCVVGSLNTGASWSGGSGTMWNFSRCSA